MLGLTLGGAELNREMHSFFFQSYLFKACQRLLRDRLFRVRFFQDLFSEDRFSEDWEENSRTSTGLFYFQTPV
jgi:hypothetical protein